MKNKNRNQENSIEILLQRSKKVDLLFSEASKKLQNDLNELEKTFHKLIDEVIPFISLYFQNYFAICDQLLNLVS